jgi:hypothetical protein
VQSSFSAACKAMPFNPQNKVNTQALSRGLRMTMPDSLIEQYVIRHNLKFGFSQSDILMSCGD